MLDAAFLALGTEPHKIFEGRKRTRAAGLCQKGGCYARQRAPAAVQQSRVSDVAACQDARGLSACDARGVAHRQDVETEETTRCISDAQRFADPARRTSQLFEPSRCGEPDASVELDRCCD